MRCSTSSVIRSTLELVRWLVLVAGNEWPLDRLEMRVDVLDLRLGAQDVLDAFGHVVSVGERYIGVHLEVKRDADLVAVTVDGDVVYIAHERLGERGGQGPVAQAQPLAARLEVNDDLAVGK